MFLKGRAHLPLHSAARADSSGGASMSILGVVVRARPGDAADVQRHLCALPGLLIAGCADGRFVVVLEDTEQASASQTMTQITRLQQVINTSLVYEYSGPDAPAPDGEAVDFKSWRGSPQPGRAAANSAE
jgi:nitrate reductase NapAB chaperone NapD